MQVLLLWAKLHEDACSVAEILTEEDKWQSLAPARQSQQEAYIAVLITVFFLGNVI